jgi:hypothetical protein
MTSWIFWQLFYYFQYSAELTLGTRKLLRRTFLGILDGRKTGGKIFERQNEIMENISL